MAADTLSQRGNVAGVVVVAVYHPEFRNAAPGFQDIGHRIECRRGGRSRILRVQGQYQQPVHVVTLQLVEGGADGWVAIAHAQFHPVRLIHNVFQRRPDRLALFLRHRQQWRACLGPYLPVSLGGTARPQPQDNAVQYRPPQQPGCFDDPGVPQELCQVFPQRSRRRRIGRAEIGEQDPDSRCSGI